MDRKERLNSLASGTMTAHRMIEVAPDRAASLELTPPLDPDDGWEINRIFVPKGFRGRGYGSELLGQVCTEADALGCRLQLWINPYGDMDYHQLVNWYGRYGFYLAKPGLFVRQPKVLCFPQQGSDVSHCVWHLRSKMQEVIQEELAEGVRGEGGEGVTVVSL